MLTRLTEFLDKNDIIYKHRFEFKKKKKKSTTQTVFDLYAILADPLDKKRYACSVVWGFEKVFDTFDFKISF